MDKLPDWPQKPTKRDWPDAHWEDVAYERARADAWESRCREAIEPLKLAAMTIGCACACKRCKTASDRVYEALARIGELPKEGE
jgi:hypothetical protein